MENAAIKLASFLEDHWDSSTAHRRDNSVLTTIRFVWQVCTQHVQACWLSDIDEERAQVEKREPWKVGWYTVWARVASDNRCFRLQV